MTTDAYIACALDAHYRDLPTVYFSVDGDGYWPRRIGDHRWVTPWNNGNRIELADVLPDWAIESFDEARRRIVVVCDTCRTAFYDEGLIELEDEELAEVLPYGSSIGDHVCEGSGCQCTCSRPRRSR